MRRVKLLISRPYFSRLHVCYFLEKLFSTLHGLYYALIPDNSIFTDGGKTFFLRDLFCELRNCRKITAAIASGKSPEIQ